MSHSLSQDLSDGFHSHSEYDSVSLHDPHFLVLGDREHPFLPALPLARVVSATLASSLFPNRLSAVLPRGICICSSLSLECRSLHDLFPHFTQICAQMTPPQRTHF